MLEASFQIFFEAKCFTNNKNISLQLISNKHCRPNGTIFDCELGCFVPIEEYQKRRSKESLVSVKEEKEEKEKKREKL